MANIDFEKEKANRDEAGQDQGNTSSDAPSTFEQSLTAPSKTEEKALLRKLDLKLLPPLTLLYLLSFLDRSNSRSNHHHLYTYQLVQKGVDN